MLPAWTTEVIVALQLGALREALEDAGARPEKASAAAEELAGYESRFSGSESRLSGIEARLTGLDSRLLMLTWAVGMNVALTLAVVGSLFALWLKLGDLAGQLAQIAHGLH
jgi:hypothetical protein